MLKGEPGWVIEPCHGWLPGDGAGPERRWEWDVTGTSSDELVPQPATADVGGGGSEQWKRRGVALRVFIYVVVGHMLAGFLWLLFFVGSHSH